MDDGILNIFISVIAEDEKYYFIIVFYYKFQLVTWRLN